MAYKGLFKPINPHKYRGDVNNIVYRSRWESRFMSFCDTNPDIVEWSSEEFFIPYRCKTDGRIHRYFPDFKVKWRKKDGTTVIQVVEIKPHHQTIPPSKPPRMSKRYLNEAMTYAKNKSKWEYAREWCANRNYQFLILTEKSLGLRF
jgi:hypothetical protein